MRISTNQKNLGEIMINSKVKTKEGYEPITAYTVNEVVLPDLPFVDCYRGKRRILSCAEYAVFDSETSHYGLECAWVYQWAFLLGGVYVYGRTAAEFVDLLRYLKRKYKLSEVRTLIIYIHNASYDVQYLKHYLRLYDENMKITATSSHAVLSVDMYGIRILCSLRLTNLSLARLSEFYAKKYIKAVGEIDYNIVRYPDSDLTESDWLYMFSDVASQHDGIGGYLESMGYRYACNAPITSTGFVRKHCLKKSRGQINWRRDFVNSQLTQEQYALCRRAFMGGITIASFLYAGDTVRSDRLRHKDFTSSYPARQMMDYFPTGAGFWWGRMDSDKTFDRCLRKYCCVFCLTLEDVCIKPGITAPYIPSSKCFGTEGLCKINGKVTIAKKLSIIITEVDYRWINRQYTYRSKRVSNLLCFNRGPAPAFLKACVMEFYNNKCTLKHSDPALYMASKAMLNSIYGMSATAIVREEWEQDDDLVYVKSESDDEAQIERYYKSRNSFLPYQLGVYTTAWARSALMEMIEAVGYDNFIYCDTDSVFYLSNDENEQRLNEMNARIRERAIAAGAFIGENVLGYATDEPKLTAFRALHAKCYCMIEDGNLQVTIAGIPKKSVVWEDGKARTVTSAEELGDIDNLVDGFTFRACGGTRAVYIEEPMQCRVIDGHRIEYASSVIIEQIEKRISDSMNIIGDNGEILVMDTVSYIT